VRREVISIPTGQGSALRLGSRFVSTQLMKPNRSAFYSAGWHHGTPEKYQSSGSGYIAYGGTYDVDEEQATVTHIPSVSLMPILIHGRQCRSIDMQVDRLVFRVAGTPVSGGLNVTNRLEWERITSS
jgi:hypothetical protein